VSSGNAKKLEWDITCFNYKEKGHMAFKCSKTAGLNCAKYGIEPQISTTAAQEESQGKEQECITEGVPSSIEDSVEQVIGAGGIPGVLSDQFNIDSSLFPMEREMKPRLSQSEKRRARQAYTQGGMLMGETAHPLEVSARELQPL
jgi:hypothetical protein